MSLPVIAGVIPEELGVKVSELGLTFSPKMSREQYARLMACLLDITDYALRYNPLFIGDALNYGELRWGDTYLQFADTYKVRVELLRDYKWVASKCPMGIRQPGLTYNHYKALAPLPTLELRAQWAEAASKNGWSTDELRQLIKSADTDDKPTPPDPKEADTLLLASAPNPAPRFKELCLRLARLIIEGDTDGARKLAEDILALV